MTLIVLTGILSLTATNTRTDQDKNRIDNVPFPAYFWFQTPFSETIIILCERITHTEDFHVNQSERERETKTFGILSHSYHAGHWISEPQCSPIEGI